MKLKQFIMAAVMMAATAYNAAATTLTFDDITDLGTNAITKQLAVPQTYGGFDANYKLSYGHDSLGSGFIQAGSVSGTHAAFNRQRAVVTITDLSGFTFNSAYFNSGMSTNVSLTLNAYETGNGSPIFTETLLLTSSAQFFNFDWAGINTLEFVNTEDTMWVMDNMTINESVPDGGTTLAMLGGVFALLAGLKRKFAR